MKNKLLLILLATVVIFVRVYNLGHNAHFVSDESRDLSRMHQMYKDKNYLTFVGPISDDGSHAFSSLTYYMLFPFALGFKFDPIGPIIGAVFWGIVALSLTLILLKRLNLYSPWSVVALVIWYPLIQTSRWAWNPNLALVWIPVGLLAYLHPGKYSLLLAGFLLGLTVHHHYLAIFPLIILGINILWQKKENTLLKVCLYIGGLAIAIAPFVIFDLTHWPGIFFFRYFAFSAPTTLTTSDLLNKFGQFFHTLISYTFQLSPLIVIIKGLVVIQLGLDFYYRSPSRSWAMAWLLPLVGLAALATIQTHYLLPLIIIFFIWLVYTRRGLQSVISKALVVLLIIGSVRSIPSLIGGRTWQGDVNSIREITSIINRQIVTEKLVNPNLAVLGSEDNDTHGVKYRDLLLIRGTRLKSIYEYPISDNLFVISQSDVDLLRTDPAVEMDKFRNGPVAAFWQVPNSPWIVYQFNRY